MQKRLTILTIILFSTQYGWGQSYSKEYSILSYSKFDDFGFLIPTFDKGYALTFYSQTGAPIVKIDSSANIQWAFKYQIGVNIGQFGDVLISQAPDSGFIIPGTDYDSAFTYYSVSALKVDKFGNPQWSKSFGDSSLVSLGQLSATMNNGFVICGWYWDTVDSTYGVLLIKTDFSGNLLWANKVDLDTIGAENPKHIIITNDGGILLTVGDIGGWGNLILAKFSSAGALLWAYMYPSSLGTEPLYVLEDNANNIIVSGRTMSFGCQDDWDGYIMKLSSNGIFQWGRTLGDSTFPDEAYSVHQLQNGNYIVCAEVESFYAWQSQTALACFDSTGNYQWMKLIRPDSSGSFPFNAVLNSNGSLTIAQIDAGYWALDNLILIRTDTNLISPCPEMSVSPVITSFSLTGYNIGTINSITGEINLSIIDSAYVITKTDLCATDGINEIYSTTNILIYPNPFSIQTTLQTDNSFHNATITVDNYLGQTVKQIKNINGQTVTFSRDNLASGLYFLRLTENNKTLAVDKFVITDK